MRVQTAKYVDAPSRGWICVIVEQWTEFGIQYDNRTGRTKVGFRIDETGHRTGHG